MANLLLIPLSYPYDIGAEKTFLENEIKYYPYNFNNIIILPSKKSAKKDALVEEITLDNSLIDYEQSSAKKNKIIWIFLKYIFILLEEVFKNIKHTAKLKGLKKAIGYYWHICKNLAFLEGYFQNKNNEEWIIYTYWFTPITVAAVILKSKTRNIAVVTRAHGIDLYEFRNNNYIPFREFAIDLIDRYFFVSEHGKQYTISRYPRYLDKYIVSPIGIRDFKIIAQPSEEGKLRIVSCSRIDENKRVNLIFQGIKKLADENPTLDITWNHFGDGPLHDELATLQNEQNKFTFKLHGHVENKNIIDFYKENEIDAFILTSISEGRPISISEALCCSVPVIATSVGGIPDLVDNSNGILLSENPSDDEIANALKWFAVNKKAANVKRIMARKAWENKCAADLICNEFISRMKEIRI